MRLRLAAIMLILTMLCTGYARGEEGGFAEPNDALHAWLTALKEQDFVCAAACFAAEPLADNINEEVWTNGRTLPILGDGSQGCVLIPHEAYREMNVANLKARAMAVTMHAAAALTAAPEEEYYYHSTIGYSMYSRYYSGEMVDEALDLLHATDFQQLESLVILGDISIDAYLLECGIQAEELAAEVSMIVSAYGAQDARPVAAAFEISAHEQCMVIMYALKYQDQWYLLGPSRLLVGTPIGLTGGTGILLFD